MTDQDFLKKFNIREYRKGDFKGISNLWLVTGLSNPLRGDTEEIIENTIKSGGMLLILENKPTNTICGTSWMTFDGRRIHLSHFGILPEFQRQGLAKLMLKKSLGFVKKKGYQVKLEVHRNNKIAIELYKKAGFSHLGDYEVYIIRDTSKINS
jgi:ribosomal protein S18 acetylase RimI-like enzyme